MKQLSTLIACFLGLLTCGKAGADQPYIYQALFFPTPVSITIDGDLSDWEGLGAKVEELGNVCQAAGPKLSPPRNKADLSANFQAIADPDNFYVAVAVNDDRLIFGESRFGEAYHDDSVEIYFDGDLKGKGRSETKENLNNVGSTNYDANDAEIRFSLDKEGRTPLEGMGLFGGKLVMLPGLWESLGIKAAIKKNPHGYTAELKVPKIVFVSVPLRPGIQIGFNVMVNDDDNGGRRDSKISWTADLFDQSWMNTNYFGRLLLVRALFSEKKITIGK